MKSKSYEINMTEGPLMPKLVSFFLPLMFSGILQLLFNTVDTIVVGRFTGKEALAAVGSTTALISIFANLLIGISLGANVMAAQFFAADKKEELSDTVHTSITVAFFMGFTMTFIGLFLSPIALRIMATPEDVIGQSIIYIRIYFCGMTFFMLYNYGAAILRAIGDTKRPLIFLIIAGSVNVVLNLILVIVFHMGVAGVAIATVVSQMISCVLVLRTLMKSEGNYQLILSKLGINKTILIKIFQIGLPAGLQSTIINISNAMLQSSVNSFGSIAMAGYTAANNMLGFCYTSVNSVTQACMNFTSQNLGAGKSKRINQTLINCIFLQILVGGFMGGMAYIFSPQLLSIYTSDPNVISSGIEILTISAIPYFLCGIMDLIPGAMRGMGASAVPMILSIIGTVGTRIVWIYGLFPTHRSLFFLFISYPGSWTITILLQAVCYYFVHKSVWRSHGFAS